MLSSLASCYDLVCVWLVLATKLLLCCLICLAQCQRRMIVTSSPRSICGCCVIAPAFVHEDIRLRAVCHNGACFLVRCRFLSGCTCFDYLLSIRATARLLHIWRPHMPTRCEQQWAYQWALVGVGAVEVDRKSTRLNSSH